MPLARIGNALLRSGSALCTDCCQGEICNCGNSEFVYNLSGVVPLVPPTCSTSSCQAINGVYVLPQNSAAFVLQQANCQPDTPTGSDIINNPDDTCAYQLIVPRCGTGNTTQDYQLDAIIYWKQGVGWVSVVGFKMPASKTYNFQGGNVADVCWVLVREVLTADSFDLCNFSAQYDTIDDVCGVCGAQVGCDFLDILINGSVQPV